MLARNLLIVFGLSLSSTIVLSFAPPSLTKRSSVGVEELEWRNHPHTMKRVSHHGIKTKRHGMLPSIPMDLICSSPISQNRALAISIHTLLMNTIYLFRRSHIRNMPKRKLLQIRLTREEGVQLPLYIANITMWQLFVNFVFPLLELVSRMFAYVSFYYFYPNAGGFGIIFEPLSVQPLPMSKRAKSQIRLDWHRFSVNVGDIGREGYKHPPSVERNLPHIDSQKMGLKHWPWRRKYKFVKGSKGTRSG
mmetsp:Transcript_39859/g.67991  ORF Transcript_39859/g.67991 Transcript_39859/m.67991 type:complete len:249 (-) Transcript_39859:208-954(-)